MFSLTHRGATFRTKLMEQSQAERFARCLRANPRFANVELVTSKAAKSERNVFVAFEPASEERQAELLGQVQGEREVRAATEGQHYVFCLDTSRRFFWVYNPKSQETYEVTPESCSCADHVYRCRAQGLKCKHSLALIHGYGHLSMEF